VIALTLIAELAELLRHRARHRQHGALLAT